MCYIMGVFSPVGSIDFTRILDLARRVLLLRGRDAVGAYCRRRLTETGRTQGMLLSKEQREAQLRRFLSFKDLSAASGYCLMLQSRATPEPEVSDSPEKPILVEDIQPFDRDGWVVSHNGGISNDRELRQEMNDVSWDTESTVDSVVLPYLFSRAGVRAAVNKLDGSFALAAYCKDEGSFYLAKNFQPLYYGVLDERLYYSSLPTELTPTEFPPYALLHWDAQGKPSWFNLYREPVDKSVLVLLSSGLDSVTTLRLYQVLGYRVGAVFFKYGQQAESVEDYCSKKICEILNVPRYCISLPMDQFSSPLLEKEKVDLDPLKDAESTFSYVPQRNLIMTSFGLAIAEQNHYSHVAIGTNLSDGGSYPDNGVPFLAKLGEMTPYSSNWQVHLKVTSPFVNLTKSEMVEVGLQIGVPFEYVCSCYYPELSDDGFPIYCNNCGSDVHYKSAWGKLGYRPPNLGFEGSSHLIRPVLFEYDSSFRMSLEGIYYHNVIKETL